MLQGQGVDWDNIFTEDNKGTGNRWEDSWKHSQIIFQGKWKWIQNTRDNIIKIKQWPGPRHMNLNTKDYKFANVCVTCVTFFHLCQSQNIVTLGNVDLFLFIITAKYESE